MNFTSELAIIIRDFRREKPLHLITLFLFCYTFAYTFSPLVLYRSTAVSPVWSSWLGFTAWLATFAFLNSILIRHYPLYDKLLLHIVSLLVGWGLLTIWRLTGIFGLRQSIWLVVAAAILWVGIKFKSNFTLLRRYKYIWLISGLGLTAMTFLFGVNPQGLGPRLWLGCCGLYLQPSEPLKLLLVIFLAAYLADRQPLSDKLAPLLAPTAVMLGTALLMLLAQRDLGTAFIFLLIYIFVIYVATGRRIILWIGVPLMGFAAYVGSLLFDVVQLRMEAWINPWLDPSGRSYQIVQSLMAIASGGLIGRGPGLGNPEVVPVPHSDFIFTSMVEETGLVGAFALLILLSLFFIRGLRIAVSLESSYHRYLATGVVAYFSMQSILIIGGNVRLLPLTGVTLPFASYGGSSLVTSFAALFILIHLSQYQSKSSDNFVDPAPIIAMGKTILTSFGLLAIVIGWWSIVRGPDLLARTDNPRRAIADLYVPRGSLQDRLGNTIAETVGIIGELERQHYYSSGGSVFGYSHPIYGQAGIESSLDGILRGLEYQTAFDLWTNHLHYGQPPPGIDVMLTIDPVLQARAESLITGHNGAVILMDAVNGDILAMVSNPSFDPNILSESWRTLIQDDRSPLINRVTQGSYQPGTSLGPFLYTSAIEQGLLPQVPVELNHQIDEMTLQCTRDPSDLETWEDLISVGCPSPTAELGLALQGEQILSLFTELGFYSSPEIRIPTTISTEAPLSIPIPEAAAIGQSDLLVSPLQIAMATATLSNRGILPTPRLVLGVDHEDSGFEDLAALGESHRVFSTASATTTALQLQHEFLPIWQSLATAVNGPDQFITWYLAGSLPGEDGNSIIVVVMLEIDFPSLAESIGQTLILLALNPIEEQE